MSKRRKEPDLKAMFMANYVKAIAEPYTGIISKRRIYMREIAHRVPICMSSFYRYMRMSTADYQVLMDEYARRQCENAERELRELNERRRLKRLAAAKAKAESAVGAEHGESEQADESPAVPVARKPRLAASDVDRKSVPVPKKARRGRSADGLMSETPQLNRPPYARETEAEEVAVPHRQPEPAEA